MLRHIVGRRRPFAILPVLASYLHEALWTAADPEADPRVPRFVDALRETMAASSRRVCLVAGVDLAHVGPRFGDREPNTEASLARVERDDRAMLESVVGVDAAGFFAGSPPTTTPAASAAFRRSTRCCDSCRTPPGAWCATPSGRIPRAR